MNSIQRIAISVVGVAALAWVAGCGTSTKEVDSTTYVPAAAPAQVVVQAPPVVVTPPTTTTSTSSDRSSNSTDSGSAGTVDSSSSHHSESTTVTLVTNPQRGRIRDAKQSQSKKNSRAGTRDRAVDWRRTACLQCALRAGYYRLLNSASHENDSVNVKAEHRLQLPG